MKVSFFLAASAVWLTLAVAPATGAETSSAQAICESLGVRGAEPNARAKACTEILAAGRLDPKQEAAARINRGWAYGQAQRWAEARADYDRAIALDPRSTIPYNERALLNLRLGKLDAALRDYQQALKRAPNAPYSLYGRGLTYLRKGQAEPGRADLAMARRLAPDIDDVFKSIGVTP